MGSAYANLVRATYYANEAEKAKVELENLKIYHAHGYVVHSENYGSGDEIWERGSAFSEVFFDFESAKQYLLKNFEEQLSNIYRRDKLFEGCPEKECKIENASDLWRKEYLDEYIAYELIISQVTPNSANQEHIDFTKPQKIEWCLSNDGEILTRFYVFGNKEYECRESDLLPEAGTKFKVGDLVEYDEMRWGRDYVGALVIVKIPDKPKSKSTPWENLYKVAYIAGDSTPGSLMLGYYLILIFYRTPFDLNEAYATIDREKQKNFLIFLRCVKSAFS